MTSSRIQAASHDTDNWSAQLRKGSLELAVLASLWNKPLYGLEVLRLLQDIASLDVAEGTLYPILNRLRSEGLLQSEWVDSGTGHPRKYYKLTGEGRHRLLSMSKAWAEFSKNLQAILDPILDRRTPKDRIK